MRIPSRWWWSRHGQDRSTRIPKQTVPTRLLFVEQFFYPEGWGGAELPRDLVTHFSRLGWRVQVFCGSDQYVPVDGPPGQDPREEGVRIHRIPSVMRGSDARHGKLLRQLWFCAWLAPLLLLRRPPDLFISQTNPPLVVPLVALAARLWRRPYLLIAMDVYPELLTASGALSRGGMAARILEAVFGWAYRSATRVVALGPVMSERIRAKGVRDTSVLEISNWSTGAKGVARGQVNRLCSDLGLQDSFVLVCAGNMGLAHEFDTLLRGFSSASRQLPALKLVFIGGGPRLAEVRALVQELNLATAVMFLDPVPSDRLPEAIGLADVGVVTLREGFEGLVVPSRVFGYMSRGVPVLYIGPRSDIDVLISRHGCGVSVRCGDAAAVSRAIIDAHGNRGGLAELGRAGQAGFERELSRERALSRYESLVRSCLDVPGN